MTNEAEARADSMGLTRAALWVYLLDVLGFGLLLFLLPAFVVETLAGSAEIEYVYVRPFGGVLLALAWAAWRALQEPNNRRTLITLFAFASLAAGLGLSIGWIAGEYTGAAWFLWLTFGATFGVAGLLLTARSKSDL